MLFRREDLQSRLLWLLIPSLGGGEVWWWLVAKTFAGRAGLLENDWPNVLGTIALGLVALGFWLAAAALGGYLIRGRFDRWVLALLVSWPWIIFFPLNRWTVVMGVLCWFGLGWAIRRTAEEARDQVRLRPQRALMQGLPLAVLMVVLAVSLAYYQQFSLPGKSPSDQVSKLTDQTVTLTERFLPRFYPSYRANMTVDELIGAQLPSAEELVNGIDLKISGNKLTQDAENKLREAGVDVNKLNVDRTKNTAELQRAIDKQLDSFRQDTIDQSRQELGDRFKIDLRGDETVHEVIQSLINRQFTAATDRFSAVIPILLGVALFFILKVFSGLMVWVAMVVGWWWWHGLKMMKVVMVATVDEPVEKPSWGGKKEGVLPNPTVVTKKTTVGKNTTTDKTYSGQKPYKIYRPGNKT